MIRPAELPALLRPRTGALRASRTVLAHGEVEPPMPGFLWRICHMKVLVNLIGMALLLVCGGCETGGGYGAVYGGVSGEYPSTYYGSGGAPVYAYPPLPVYAYS